MKQLRTEIEIAARAERVWGILMDFAAYPKWNPFIVHISGVPSPGGKLEARLKPPEGRAMTFRPTVTATDANRRFSWLGRVLVPGLFDGEHIFELETAGEGVRFVQREDFRGVLVPLLWGMVEKSTRNGFVAMNEALKARAEAAPPTG